MLSIHFSLLLLVLCLGCVFGNTLAMSLGMSSFLTELACSIRIVNTQHHLAPYDSAASTAVLRGRCQHPDKTKPYDPTFRSESINSPMQCPSRLSKMGVRIVLYLASRPNALQDGHGVGFDEFARVVRSHVRMARTTPGTGGVEVLIGCLLLRTLPGQDVKSHGMMLHWAL
ncbi:hypothetical protein F4861DRAFT_215270 [Xylaria intraflava]|nr:hypothetical protein F4861DRAFT_215270 [Xylaria intraflava]